MEVNRKYVQRCGPGRIKDGIPWPAGGRKTAPFPSSFNMASTTPVPGFYLSFVAGDLVLKVGQNPVPKHSSAKRILIVGGGVTGLTVSIF